MLDVNQYNFGALISIAPAAWHNQAINSYADLNIDFTLTSYNLIAGNKIALLIQV